MRGCLGRFAILHAAKVRHLALEARVVGELEERVILYILVVRAVRVVQRLQAFLAFIDALVLGSLDGHLVDSLFHLEEHGQLTMQLNVVRLHINLRLAGRAVEEGPGYSGRWPSTHDALPNTFNVENVFAAENN